MDENADGDSSSSAADQGLGVVHLQNQVDVLLSRINHWESSFSCYTVLENLMRLMLKHYEQVIAKMTATPISLTQNYYIIHNGKSIPIPSDKERLIESLWLDRISEATIDILGTPCVLKLHPSKLYDDKPLPYITYKGESIGVRRQSSAWRHSFMCKNAPNFPGLVFDSTDANEWYSLGNFASAEDTIIMPGNPLLEKLVASWLGRPTREPPNASLLVDSKLIRSFVYKIVHNEKARCHFMCLGQSDIFAYLVLTANDGMQSELSRLPVGTVSG